MERENFWEEYPGGKEAVPRRLRIRIINLLSIGAAAFSVTIVSGPERTVSYLTWMRNENWTGGSLANFETIVEEP